MGHHVTLVTIREERLIRNIRFWRVRSTIIVIIIEISIWYTRRGEMAANIRDESLAGGVDAEKEGGISHPRTKR